MNEEAMRQHGKNIRELVQKYISENDDLELIQEANLHALNYTTTVGEHVWKMIDEQDYPNIYEYIKFHDEMGNRPKEMMVYLLMEAKSQEKFGDDKKRNNSMKHKRGKRKFKINREAKQSECRLIEDGEVCKRQHHSRSLCTYHYNYLKRSNDLFEKYAGKNIYKHVENTKFKVNKNHKKGICRIIEDNQSCKRLIHARGMCKYHAAKLNRHNLIEKYGTKSNRCVGEFTIKQRVIDGVCRIKEGGVGCKGEVLSRGLCAKHMSRFRRSNQIKKFATYRGK